MLIVTSWRSRVPVNSLLVNWADSSGCRNTMTKEVAMTIRKRRSDRSVRGPLLSPGRPPVAGRDERRRFWAAIAAGMASEVAAIGAGVPQAVGTRWFRKAGGMPPAMFARSAKPLSGRYLSFAEREEIALLRVQGTTMQEAARQLGRAASTISRELRRKCRHQKRRPRVSRDDSAMARRASCSSPKAGEACTQRRVKNLCGGTVGWRRRGSERRSCCRPGRVLEKSSAWTTEEAAVGKRLEPGADRSSPAGGFPGRRDHAHQPRSHLSSAVRSTSRRVTSRTDGLPAHRPRVADAEGAHARARQDLPLSRDHDQPTSGGGSRSHRAGPLGRRPHPGSWECGDRYLGGAHDALHSSAAPATHGGPWPRGSREERAPTRRSWRRGRT